MPRFDTPINTNDQSLDRVLTNPLPTLLMLTKGDLNPTLQAVLEEIARVHAGDLLVVRLNTSENPQAARRFNVNGGPTLVSWKGGSEQLHLDNPLPEQIRAAAEHLLGRGPAPRTERHAAQEPAPTGSSPGRQSDGHPITVDEANFEQVVLRSPQPVLVDFWAPWCGPCRMVAPTLEKLAREYAGKARVAKLNVDQNQRLASRYGVQGIPYLVMFKGGKPVQQLVGAHPEPNIRKLIEQAIR